MILTFGVDNRGYPCLCFICQLYSANFLSTGVRSSFKRSLALTYESVIKKFLLPISIYTDANKLLQIPPNRMGSPQWVVWWDKPAADLETGLLCLARDCTVRLHCPRLPDGAVKPPLDIVWHCLGLKASARLWKGPECPSPFCLPGFPLMEYSWTNGHSQASFLSQSDRNYGSCSWSHIGHLNTSFHPLN